MTSQKDKAVMFAGFILSRKSTVRECALAFNLSKSTVNYYLNRYLSTASYPLYLSYKTYARENYRTKHIKGGESTRKKYEERKKCCD